MHAGARLAETYFLVCFT
uniref:Uncharacterized protein n=1 Tax=Arundo donax TaxID=35708 RepID=A0A0A9FSD6_ARUDO